MIDWKKVFSSEFFLQIDRVRLHRADWLILILGAALVVSGLIVVLIKRSKTNPFAKKLLTRLTQMLVTTGFLEIIWFGLRYEAVRWFGTRVAAALVLAGGLVWLGFILNDFRKRFKKETEAWQKEQLKMKYLGQK